MSHIYISVPGLADSLCKLVKLSTKLEGYCHQSYVDVNETLTHLRDILMNFMAVPQANHFQIMVHFL